MCDFRECAMNQLARFQILILSALSAHELAGGALVQTPHLLWQALGITVVLFIIRNIRLDGPNLALLILFIQSTSHFLIGGGSYQSEVKMTFAHLISGVISYFAIAYFDIAWDFLSQSFAALLPAKPFNALTIPKRIRLSERAGFSIPQLRQLIACLQFRGPPMRVVWL